MQASLVNDIQKYCFCENYKIKKAAIAIAAFRIYSFWIIADGM